MSRKIKPRQIGFALQAVERALVTSPQYVARLEAALVRISMDGKGQALDNIFTERLWRTVKYEEVCLREYASPRAARQGLTHYLEFYNHERPHQSLAYRTPGEVDGLSALRPST